MAMPSVASTSTAAPRFVSSEHFASRVRSAEYNEKDDVAGRLVGKDGEAGETGTPYWWSGGLGDRGIEIPFHAYLCVARRKANALSFSL
jgi:hypothetical protein